MSLQRSSKKAAYRRVRRYRQRAHAGLGIPAADVQQNALFWAAHAQSFVPGAWANWSFEGGWGEPAWADDTSGDAIPWGWLEANGNRSEQPALATLERYFKPLVKASLAGGRRALDAPMPAPREKPNKAGRTNHPAISALPGAAQSDRQRRLRPRSMAIVHPPVRRPARETIAFLGYRDDRPEPLAVEDLWVSPSGPGHVDDVLDDFKCGICLQLKSHPVSYVCGHGHCFTCIRIWLEEQWECPQCRATMTRAPFRVYAEEAHIARVYGTTWDVSVVNYDWTGLDFPVIGAKLVSAADN
ncbi:hypothetical protein DFH09DRAFT_1483267 [Mycena vulgaris]|nr:hypothetical protein DFH09DRAFT_1483267 [Mycena vulgaris]